MATLDTKRFKIETPDSFNDSIYEEYEFMLSWYNREGSPVQWLFCDWENIYKVNSNTINQEDSDKIQSFPQSEENLVNLVAEDIDRSEIELFKSLLSSKKICRILTSGEIERLAVFSGSITWIQSKQRFQVRVSVQKSSDKLWT